jgi:hypothetical protein
MSSQFCASPSNACCIIPHAPIALQRRHEPGRLYRRTEGEYDWIVHDPAFDFGALFRQFDTLLMGRRTFDLFSNKTLSRFELQPTSMHTRL